MPIVDPSEHEDFVAALRRYGFLEDEFELRGVEDLPRSSEPRAIHGSVTITQKATGTARTYAAGFGTAWPVEFERDLSSRSVFKIAART